MGNAPNRRSEVEGCARMQLAHVGPARSVRAGIAILLLIPQVTACYSYVPTVNPSLPSGARVSVGITDRGRVALAERVGPGVRNIVGEVVTSADSAVELSVSNVQFIDLAVPLKWSGERVTVSRDFVSEVRERRLSRTRTWLAAGLVTAGLVATSFIAIRGFGGDPPNDRPGGDGDDQRYMGPSGNR